MIHQIWESIKIKVENTISIELLLNEKNIILSSNAYVETDNNLFYTYLTCMVKWHIWLHRNKCQI